MKNKKTQQQMFINLYRDFNNNFINVSKFAKRNGISNEMAYKVIKIGKNFYDQQFPIKKNHWGVSESNT